MQIQIRSSPVQSACILTQSREESFGVSRSVLGLEWILALPALWSGSALNTAGFRSVQVMGRDPILGVCFCTARNSRSIRVWLLASSVNLLGRGLGRFALLLLWEVWRNPDVVEEITDSDCAAEKEQVEEDADFG